LIKSVGLMAQSGKTIDSVRSTQNLHFILITFLIILYFLLK
jgi:hypothetical protein